MLQIGEMSRVLLKYCESSLVLCCFVVTRVLCLQMRKARRKARRLNIIQRSRDVMDSLNTPTSYRTGGSRRYSQIRRRTNK